MGLQLLDSQGSGLQLLNSGGSSLAFTCAVHSLCLKGLALWVAQRGRVFGQHLCGQVRLALRTVGAEA